jgi:predicted nicotinamide N-methyase
MPGYLTKQERIAIRGADSLLIRSLLDRQQYADPHGEAEAAGIPPAFWSLFGVLWPSGLQLAAHMAVRPMKTGERILEIGCGLALASLVCQRRGSDITASDCHPLAASFLLSNATLNALPPIAFRHGDWADAVLPPEHTLEPPVNGRFDVIMGSDILYERDDKGALAGFIERHALPAADVLIVDPNRGNRAAFSHRMQDQGFTLTETMLRTPEADGLPYKGRLLHYARAA